MTTTAAGHDVNGTPREVRVADNGTLDLSCGNWEDVTPDDTDAHDFAICRVLYVGDTGHVKVLTEQGQTRTFRNVPDGAPLIVRCTRVFATGTTASNIMAGYG